MRYQVCSIKNGELRHFYRNNGGRMWMSTNKATMLTLEQARGILKSHRHHSEMFIQAEYECHFREVDEDDHVIPIHKAN